MKMTFSITNPGTGGKLMVNQNDVKTNSVNETKISKTVKLTVP